MNSACAAYCDVCPDTDTSDTDVIQKQILKILEQNLSELCRYATADCQRMLTNLYSCASHSILMTNELDVNVVAVIKNYGESLALYRMQNSETRRCVETPRSQEMCCPVFYQPFLFQMCHRSLQPVMHNRSLQPEMQNRLDSVRALVLLY